MRIMELSQRHGDTVLPREKFYRVQSYRVQHTVTEMSRTVISLAQSLNKGLLTPLFSTHTLNRTKATIIRTEA